MTDMFSSVSRHPFNVCTVEAAYLSLLVGAPEGIFHRLTSASPATEMIWVSKSSLWVWICWHNPTGLCWQGFILKSPLDLDTFRLMVTRYNYEARSLLEAFSFYTLIIIYFIPYPIDRIYISYWLCLLRLFGIVQGHNWRVTCLPWFDYSPCGVSAPYARLAGSLRLEEHINLHIIMRTKNMSVYFVLNHREPRVGMIENKHLIERHYQTKPFSLKVTLSVKRALFCGYHSAGWKSWTCKWKALGLHLLKLPE